jgi:Protein of unknown function (DUF2839)
MGKSKPKKGTSQPNSKSIAKQDEKILPWTSITRKQADQFVQLTTTGAWAGIGLLILLWIAVRVLGPSLGLWSLSDTP